jgi:hypothetical protein
MGMTRNEMRYCGDLKKFNDIVIGKKIYNLVWFQRLNKLRNPGAGVHIDA